MVSRVFQDIVILVGQLMLLLGGVGALYMWLRRNSSQSVAPRCQSRASVVLPIPCKWMKLRVSMVASGSLQMKIL